MPNVNAVIGVQYSETWKCKINYTRISDVAESECETESKSQFTDFKAQYNIHNANINEQVWTDIYTYISHQFTYIYLHSVC